MKFNNGKHRVLHLGRINPMHEYRKGTDSLESSSAEKDLRDLVETKLTMNQQRILAAKAANRNSVASRPRGVILPLWSAPVRSHLECWVQHWAHQYKNDMYILERVQ